MQIQGLALAIQVAIRAAIQVVTQVAVRVEVQAVVQVAEALLVALGGDISALIFMVIYFIIIMIVISRVSKNKNVLPTRNIHGANEEEIANKVKQVVPTFNKEEFLKQGFSIYKDVQNAWMDFKLDDVRDVITDELYNMYSSQLDTLEVKGEQNIMKDMILKDSALVNMSNQNGVLTLTTKYIIEQYDYIADKNTGKVLRGSGSRKMRVVYQMKFRMNVDTASKIDKCPNCGAKLNNFNGAGVCEYCGSKIVSENSKWVLTEKTVISQINL